MSSDNGFAKSSDEPIGFLYEQIGPKYTFTKISISVYVGSGMNQYVTAWPSLQLAGMEVWPVSKHAILHTLSRYQIHMTSQVSMKSYEL